MLSIEESICRNGQTSVSAGCRVEPKAPPTTGSHAEEVSFGMTPVILKGTFGVEMHLIH